ncbi:MAG: 7-cyano-7-deazaguanine synthase [Methanobrevibacter sp.]|jgi:7-cyano-7-deazaguanine synthase in queuosine biosynthesis|nr:7-cyano-7-deazaguanine synthase [Candidatus Methanovirga basalitermitum]
MLRVQKEVELTIEIPLIQGNKSDIIKRLYIQGFTLDDVNSCVNTSNDKKWCDKCVKCKSIQEAI